MRGVTIFLSRLAHLMWNIWGKVPGQGIWAPKHSVVTPALRSLASITRLKKVSLECRKKVKMQRFQQLWDPLVSEISGEQTGSPGPPHLRSHSAGGGRGGYTFQTFVTQYLPLPTNPLAQIKPA